MGLTEELYDLKKQLGRDIPQEILKEIGQFVQGLARSGIKKTSCQAEDKVPTFTLPNAKGHLISSKDLLVKGPMVLSFYRGVW